MTTRRIRRRRRKSKVLILAVAASFLVLTIVALYFVKMSSRYSYENAQLRKEMATVLNRLDGMEQSIDQINTFTDTYNDQTKDNVAKVTGQTGLKKILKKETKEIDSQNLPKYSEVKLYDGSPLGENYFVHLLDRVNELTINANLVAHRLQGLKGIVASRREILSSVPSTFPAYGRLSSGFGFRKSPFTGKRALHKGIDIAAAVGTPVVAPADGVITYVGKGRTYGRTVVISHGYGIMTKFAHNSKIIVRRGQKVTRGQIISEIGNTGRSTGPHLHYEVWINGKAVNPKRFLLDDDTNQMLARLAFNNAQQENAPKSTPTAESEKIQVPAPRLSAAIDVSPRNAEIIARDMAAQESEEQDNKAQELPAPREGMALAAKPLLTETQARAVANSEAEVATDVAEEVESDYEFMEFAQVSETSRESSAGGVGGDFETPMRLSGASQLNQLPAPEWELYINLAIAAALMLLLAMFFTFMRRQPRRAHEVER